MRDSEPRAPPAELFWLLDDLGHPSLYLPQSGLVMVDTVSVARVSWAGVQDPVFWPPSLSCPLAVVVVVVVVIGWLVV